MEKKLSDFEYDMLWMSYRYCIGRHSIASNMHAGNIIQNCYNRLTDEQKSQTSEDIITMINDNVRLINSWYSNIGDPKNVLMEILDYVVKNHLESSFHNIKDINLHTDRFTIDGTIDNSAYDSNIKELLVWCDVASALNKKFHKVVITKMDGQEIEHECFESWVEDFTNSKFPFKKVYKCLDGYVKNPFNNAFIAPEYIISVK